MKGTIVGRKKMKTEDKFDIRLRVDESLHQRIAKAADEAELSVAAFIRTSVVKELRRLEQESK